MVKVDKEKCISCGFCVSVAPDVFKMGDDGKSHIKEGASCKGDECKEASEGCPVNAIEL